MDKISQPKIEFRDPRKLSVHRLAKLQPGEWSDDDPQFKALCADLQARGFDQPLAITGDGHVADGRHRLRYALRHQLTVVPCRIIDDKDVSETVLHTLLHRRHYTKGQLAYLLAPTIDDAFLEAQQRMLAGVKPDPRNSVSRVPNVEEWATKIGVSVQYLRQARFIHEAFADTTKRKFNEDGKKAITCTLREYFEPRILDPEDPIGLGPVKAGIASVLDAEKKGKPHKGGKPANVERQLTLFNNVIKDELNRWEYWQKFDDETKAEHFAAVRAQVAQIDDAEQLEQMADYHSKLASELRKAAKEAAAANGAK